MLEPEDAGAGQLQGEAPPAPLSMAQVLRGLQASDAALDDPSCLEAWEHDLCECEAEFQRRIEQLQLAMIDANHQD